jgi:hypothetical protein
MTSDTDFYLLIQSSIMSILGIAIGYYPISWQPISVAKRWEQDLGVIGILCCIVAIPIYLYFATIWSALVSFIAARCVGPGIHGFTTCNSRGLFCPSPKKE